MTIKITSYKILAGFIHQYMCLVPQDRKFCNAFTSEIIIQSCRWIQDFSALTAARAFEAIEKYAANEDPAFRARALVIKEERSDLVKHHLWVLWTDYFKPEHLERFPDLHDKFWKATKTAGEAKKTNDGAVGERLLAEIAEIDAMFWESKK